MRIVSVQDPKVVEFLEYMGVGKCGWCQIRTEANGMVQVEQGVGTKPPWHAERQQAALLKTIVENTRIMDENAKKIEAATRSMIPPEDLEELTELTAPDL